MAIRFDASGDSYTRATATIADIVPSTVMAWVYLSADRNDFAGFFTLNNASEWYLGTNSDGTTLAFYDGSFHDGSALSLDTWYHIACVSNGTQRTVYLNGVQDIDFGGSGSSILTPTEIWGNTQGGAFLNGRLAAGKIYTVALSLQEILQEMWSYLPRRTANLYGWWPMLNQPTGTIDFSGNAKTLTENGTLATEDGPPISWGISDLPLIIPSGPSILTVIPDSIASAEAFGTLSIDLTVAPSSIASAEAFGSPTVLTSIIITPSSMGSEEAFGTPVISGGEPGGGGASFYAMWEEIV